MYSRKDWQFLELPGSRDPGIPEVLIPNPGIEKPGPGLQSLTSTLNLHDENCANCKC